MPAESEASLWSAAQAAAADRHTIDTLGIPSAILMERASLAVARVVARQAERGDLMVLALCGPGNNGGDGVAVARLLAGRGLRCHVALTTERRSATVDEQVGMARAMGVPIHEVYENVTTQLDNILAGNTGGVVVVDALLGTGARGRPRGSIAQAIEWVRRNSQDSRIAATVAVDVPSGVDPDRGGVSGEAIEATATVTFQRSKPGLHLMPGRAHSGYVTVARIGLVAEVVDQTASLLDPRWVERRLTALGSAAHKGERGSVLCVGGSPGTEGALVLAGAGALRAGAGLVTLAGGPALAEAAVRDRPELMTCGFDDPWPTSDALVVGPGLTAPEQQARAYSLWADDARPAVWDAGALASIVGPSKAPRVVTPHPKEAARLLRRLAASEAPPGDWTVAAVQADRIAATRLLARVTGGVAVLKGEATVVGASSSIAVCTSGSSSLATAGSGDVLAGVIAALLARGLSVWDAARVGVQVHAAAGDALGDAPGPVAMDIAEAVGREIASPSGSSGRWPELYLG